MTVSALSVHVLQLGAQSRLYRYHWVRYRESAQCQRLVPPLWPQLSPIEAAFCAHFCLITNNRLTVKSAYCLHDIGTWSSTRTYSAASVSPTHTYTHTKRLRAASVSVFSSKTGLLQRQLQNFSAACTFYEGSKTISSLPFFFWKCPMGPKKSIFLHVLHLRITPKAFTLES